MPRVVAAGSRATVDVDAVEDEAFALAEDYGPFASSPHAHDKHQILFSARGTLVLTADDRRWTLPPERGAWIHRRVLHAAASSSGVELRTVYLHDRLVREPPPGCRVFAVTPLAREMLLHAVRWGPGEAEPSPARAPFFHALAALATEWIATERPYFLPRAKSAALSRAMSWIDAHLADATVEGAAAAAHVAVRTLSRRFDEEAKTTFRAYLQGARMMHAMALLAQPGSSVSSTAYAVGFRSIGAFTTAFTERCGETPTEYRSRVTR